MQRTATKASQREWADPTPISWDPEEEQVEDKLLTNSYDPVLDPCYRLARGWAETFQETLKDLGMIPLTKKSVLIFRTAEFEPAQTNYWSFTPHKDPTLLLKLASSFRLAELNIKSGPDPSRFPLEADGKVITLLSEDITVPELTDAAKNVARLISGTEMKISAQRPKNAAGKFAEDEKFTERKRRKPAFSIELTVNAQVRSSFKEEFPHIPSLNPDLGKEYEAFTNVWEKLTRTACQTSTRFWHKGHLATMLSDDYWNYAVTKVAARITRSRLRTLLHPAPVTQWWLQKLVTWAAMDMLAFNATEGWMPKIADKPAEFMELVYANWSATDRYLAEKDRQKAVNIRNMIGIPPFSAGQTQIAALMLAKLYYWVGKSLPSMASLLMGQGRVALDAADHPFWRKRLVESMTALWPARNQVPRSGKYGRVLFQADFRFTIEEAATHHSLKYAFAENAKPTQLINPINGIIHKVLSTRDAVISRNTDEIMHWLHAIQSYL